MWQVAEELGGRSGFGTRAVEGRGGAFIISGVQTEPGSRGQPFAGTRGGLAAREWPDVPRGVILMARPARPVTEEGRPAPSRPPASKKGGTSGPPGECAGVFSVGHEHRSPAGVGEPPRRVVQGFLPRARSLCLCPEEGRAPGPCHRAPGRRLMPEPLLRLHLKRKTSLAEGVF